MSQHLQRATFWLLVLCSVAYLGSQFWPGTFQFTDEILFKSAGKEWALRGHFAAPDIVGRLNFDPPITKIYGAYPPLYAMCYGVWTRVLGFGWTQAAVFDGFIHLALCWLTRALVIRVTRTRIIWLANLLAIAMLPAGIHGRPDEMAMVFAIVAILISIKPISLQSSALAGVFWGLCLASSLAAFVGIGVTQTVWFWFSLRNSPTSLRWTRLAVLAGVVLIVQLFVWAPILWVDPRAIHQMVQHATDAENAKSLLTNFAWHWRYVKYGIAPTAAIFVGLLAAAPLLIIRKDWMGLAPLLAFFLAMLIFSSSHNSIYLWMIFPMGVAVLWQSVGSLSGRAQSILSAFACALIGAALFLSSELTIVNTIALAMIPPSQSMAANAKILQQLIPAGSNVLLRDHWYSLAATCQTVDSGFCGIDDVRRAEYVVFTGNGSAVPGQRWKLAPPLEAELADHFEMIFNDLPSGVPTLFGHRLTNSSRGFGVEVYRRRESIRVTQQSS